MRTSSDPPSCQMPCDADCEIGPVHCWNYHRPNHGAARRDWHDPAECDERPASMRQPFTFDDTSDERELRPVSLVPVDEAEDEW